MEQSVISVKAASEIMGVRPARIRYLMTRGIIDIGRVVEPENKKGNKSYIIYKDKLMKEIGKV